MFKVPPAATELLATAQKAALQAGYTTMQPEHILMAILKPYPTSGAADALREKGVTLQWP